MKNNNFKIKIQKGNDNNYFVTVETFIGNVGDIVFSAGEASSWTLQQAQEVAFGVKEMIEN